MLRQVRGKSLTWFQLAWPAALVIWAAITYVRGFPASGASLSLVIGSALTGTLLGLLAGAFTRIYPRDDGTVIARATAAAVAAWILGTIGRLVFGLYAEHGGGPAIASFSRAHGIAIGAWAAALVLMALCEVLGRTIVLASRATATGRARSGTQPGALLGLPVTAALAARRPGGPPPGTVIA